MAVHVKDIAKVVGAASTNVVTSAAASAVQGPGHVSPAALCSEKLHVILIMLQILVAIVTGVYISLKTYRLWKSKNAPA